GGTVLALRELLKALGKDDRLALLAMPLVVNLMFLMGFLPFLLGIPLCMLALVAAIRHFEEPSRATAIGLACLSVVLFLMHLFPYAVFGIAFIALFPWARPRAWLTAGLPVVPSLGLAGAWVLLAQTAQKSLTGQQSEPVAPIDQRLREIVHWTSNVFTDTSDEFYFVALAFVIVIAFALAQGDRDPSKKISRRYAVAPIVCALLYFTTGDMMGGVWLIAQRFPILTAFMGIPLCRMPSGIRGAVVSGLAFAVGTASIANVCKHFVAFERNEVGDIDEAIQQIPPAKRVVGLIYDKTSRIVNFAPFLHFVQYYQVEKGGVVQFSNANISYSPYHFRPDRLPPQGQPARLRWEWTPAEVSIGELYPYYDYVLTRGGGFAPPPGTYHRKWQSGGWAVWEKG
ncbi:MAG: hypothetical protein FWD17_19890, partial [Polyangiaceae bacterium]|nr:hypothetical protein [Polyangiaceae bacterium]